MSTVLKHKHLHVYERSKVNKDIYRCLDAQCRHYDRKWYLLGKEAKCWKCGRTFILTKNQLKNARPVCELCTKSTKVKKLLEAAKSVEGILEEMNLNNLIEPKKEEDFDINSI